MPLTGVQWPEVMIKRICSVLLLSLFAFTAVPVRAADKSVSDDLIYDNVRRKLATDDTVKGGGLEVEVKAGIVTLKGKVDSEKKKSKAEKIAKKVGGVKSVDNEIQVVLK